MKNPVTTILGILAALGTTFSSAPGTFGSVAHWVTAGSIALLGVFSQDAGSSQPTK